MVQLSSRQCHHALRFKSLYEPSHPGYLTHRVSLAKIGGKHADNSGSNAYSKVRFKALV